jgi:hypothetical protein
MTNRYEEGRQLVDCAREGGISVAGVSTFSAGARRQSNAIVPRRSEKEMQTFDDIDALLAHLEATGRKLWAGKTGTIDHLPAEPAGAGVYNLYAAKVADGNELAVDEEAGLGQWLPGLPVSKSLLDKLRTEIEYDDSPVRKHSIWPVRRSFVYVDISDFSKRPTGVQQFAISALASLTEKSEWGAGRSAEVRSDLQAQLCIGDGYIYVFRRAIDATYFAGRLAKLIEERAAKKTVPELHFRMGVHVGEVRYFWDPGRNDWNYVGAGINGGQRVLATIDNADDVVFVSAEVRQEILASDTTPAKKKALLDNMVNRGRRPDKHNKLWRVYELNHHAAIPE